MSPEAVHRDGPRIEAAFRSIFYRAPPPPHDDDDDEEEDDDDEEEEEDRDAAAAGGGGSAAAAAAEQKRQLLETDTEHEFDVVVCHGNVIRYFFLRALQLPPEAWLRTSTFNCSLTYLVVRPGSGRVSLRAFGDVGHLPMRMVTFSGHHGFAW